jgi:hypothetical protein
MGHRMEKVRIAEAALGKVREPGAEEEIVLVGALKQELLDGVEYQCETCGIGCWVSQTHIADRPTTTVVCADCGLDLIRAGAEATVTPETAAIVAGMRSEKKGDA